VTCWHAPLLLPRQHALFQEDLAFRCLSLLIPPYSKKQAPQKVARSKLASTSPGFGLRVDVCNLLKNSASDLALGGASHASGIIAPSEIREGWPVSLIPV
jgi:hypothetical protein